MVAQQLIKAEPEYKSHYIDALAKLGENAQYPLLDHLETATDASAPDLTKALGKMFESWGGTASPLSPMLSSSRPQVYLFFCTSSGTNPRTPRLHFNKFPTA